MEKLTQQEQVRRQKMQDLIDMGIDPFGSRYDRTSNSGIIKSSYEDKTKEELDEFEVEMEKCKINSKRRLKKEDPAMVKAFSVLPEYLVDLLVKKKGKLS